MTTTKKKNVIEEEEDLKDTEPLSFEDIFKIFNPPEEEEKQAVEAKE